jgi:hypothetical protein
MYSICSVYTHGIVGIAKSPTKGECKTIGASCSLMQGGNRNEPLQQMRQTSRKLAQSMDKYTVDGRPQVETIEAHNREESLYQAYMEIHRTCTDCSRIDPD